MRINFQIFEDIRHLLKDINKLLFRCYLLHKLEFQTSTPLTNQPSEERILNISKSSWPASVEIKWNIHINYRTITTKLAS